jgi:hypothetical protein
MGLDEFRPTSTEKIKLILREDKRERASRSRFKAQGIEAEMILGVLWKQGKGKRSPKFGQFYLGFVLQPTRL